MLFLGTAFSGWAVGVLLGIGISLPYLARALHSMRLRPHYWIGLILPAAATVHAWLPMAYLPIRRFDPTGLWLASAALPVMVWQAALGLALRSSAGGARGNLKRLHFGTMVLLVALVIGHIALDRA